MMKIVENCDYETENQTHVKISDETRSVNDFWHQK